MLKLIVVGDPLEESLETLAAYQPECQPVAEEFEEVLAERLRAAMHRQADVLAFVDTRGTRGRCAVTAEVLRRAVAALERNPDVVACLVPYEPDSALWTLWEDVPQHLAVLAVPPEYHAAVVLRAAVAAELAPPRPVREPIWDCLTRLVREFGCELMVSPEGAPSTGAVVGAAVLPALVADRPGRTRNWLHELLAAVDPVAELPQVTSPADARAVLAGLYQVNDYSDESHRISQSLEGEGRHRAADYWHAIMHRREPDYSNSKYWFRRVGTQPVFARLVRHAAAAADVCDVGSDVLGRVASGERWDPFAFVDLCREAFETNVPTLEVFCRRVQFAEMMELLRQTVADATQ